MLKTNIFSSVQIKYFYKIVWFSKHSHLQLDDVSTFTL